MYKAIATDYAIGRGRTYIIVGDSKAKILKLMGNELTLREPIKKVNDALIFRA